LGQQGRKIAVVHCLGHCAMVCVNLALHPHPGPLQQIKNVFQHGPCMPLSNDAGPRVAGPFDTHLILGGLEQDASFSSCSLSSSASAPRVGDDARKRKEDDRRGLPVVFEKLGFEKLRLPGLGRCLKETPGEEVERASSRIKVETWSSVARDPMVDSMVDELFALQDLNGDGLLEEWELIKMNQVISFLHYGSLVNPIEVQERYSRLFRKHLNANGEPAGCATFRRYLSTALQEREDDNPSQVAIVEQLIAEAQLPRAWLQRGFGCPGSSEGL